MKSVHALKIRMCSFAGGAADITCRLKTTGAGPHAPQTPVAVLRVAPTGHLATHVLFNTAWVVFMHAARLRVRGKRIGFGRRHIYVWAETELLRYVRMSAAGIAIYAVSSQCGLRALLCVRSIIMLRGCNREINADTRLRTHANRMRHVYLGTNPSATDISCWKAGQDVRVWAAVKTT